MQPRLPFLSDKTMKKVEAIIQRDLDHIQHCNQILRSGGMLPIEEKTIRDSITFTKKTIDTYIRHFYTEEQ